jgi:hypothetical protein
VCVCVYSYASRAARAQTQTDHSPHISRVSRLAGLVGSVGLVGLFNLIILCNVLCIGLSQRQNDYELRRWEARSFRGKEWCATNWLESLKA